MNENVDETHFLFDLNNGKTLGIHGSENVNHADFASGGEGITMVLRISRGVSAKIESLFLSWSKPVIAINLLLVYLIMFKELVVDQKHAAGWIDVCLTNNLTSFEHTKGLKW